MNCHSRTALFSVIALAALTTPAIGSSAEVVSDSAKSKRVAASPVEIAMDLPKAAFSGARSRDVLIAQVLLDRGRHSPGVVDGYDGGNTQRALQAFKQAHGLGSGPAIDQATLRKLAEENPGAILKTYTITSDDVDGPFKPMPATMKAMAERDRLGFTDVEEKLGEKFHMTPGLLRALNPKANWKEGAAIKVVDGGDETGPGSVAKIEVDKANSEVRAYDGEGKILATYPATVGSGDFPSPSGTMKVAAIAAEPNYTFDPEDQEWGGDKALTIPPGPNNPVGGTWIDLGKNGYGIHGTAEPSAIGKTASHGCVRLTNWDAAELAKAVQPGTTQVTFL